MNQNNVARAEAYYAAMAEKNITELEKYLHADVHFVAPLAQVQGKIAFVETLKNFAAFFKALTIRAAFGSGDQAMVAYTVEFPAPINKVPTVAFLTFQDELIIKIELFYDARPFC